MRKRVDSLLEAPGLTRPRFSALAIVSLVATSIVVAAGLREDGTPYGLVAAAYSRQPATVEVAAARHPVPAPAAGPSGPIAAPAPAPDPASTPAAAAAAVPDLPAVSTPVTPADPALTAPRQVAPTPAPSPAKAASKIKHVFVIDTATSASYLDNTLKPQGVFLGGYKPLPEGDLASELALLSGQKPTPEIQQGCPTFGTGCVFGVDTLSLLDQLASKGDTWRAYIEDLANGPDAPKSCRHPAPGASDDTAHGRVGDEYATIHNPFVYFRSLTDLGACQANDLPLDALAEDLGTTATTANFDYIAPNLCDGGWEDPCADGTPGGGQSADAFLRTWVPRILGSPAYRADGLLLVVTNSGVLAISQFLPPGAADPSDVDAYSLLRYFEDLFGLDYLGGARDAAPVMLGVPLA